MFCENCGKQIPDGTQVCPYCSAEYQTEDSTNTPPVTNTPPINNTYTAPDPFIANQKKPLDYSAISTVLGIVGLVFCFSCSGFIINIIGLIFGIKAKNESGRNAGLVMSIIGLILAIITTILSIGWTVSIIALLEQSFGSAFIM